MLSQFYKIQTKLLKETLATQLSPKGFIRFGRFILGTFAKCKRYLKKDPDNTHWLYVKEVCSLRITQIGQDFEMMLNYVDEEDEQTYLGMVELATAFSQALYEDQQEDANTKNLAYVLTQEQQEALEQLHNSLNLNTSMAGGIYGEV